MTSLEEGGSNGVGARVQGKLTLKNNSIVAVHLLLLALLTAFSVTIRLVSLDEKFWIYCTSVFLLLLFVWLLWSWKRSTGGLFDPYVLFIIAAMLFNGGQAFLEVFQLNEDGILSGEVSPETILKTLYLVILSMTSFHLGGLLSTSLFGKEPSEKLQTHLPMESRRAMRLVGWVLLSISLGPALFLFMDAIRTVMSFGYLALYQREVSTGFGAAPQVVGTFLVPAALFLLAGSKDRKSGIVVSTLVILLFSVIQLFLGYRSYAAMSLIAYTWLWHQCIRPIPETILYFAGIFMIAALFPLIGVIRGISGVERSSLVFLLDAFLSIENPIIAILTEMGGSISSIAYTLELVPSTRGYDIGVGYLYGLLTIVPNFFWDIHPAITHGAPSSWLIWTVDPITARTGGGLGYSFIAEAYLNFGWYGTPILLAVMGYLLGKLVLWAQKSGDSAKMALAASFLAFFLHYARGEFSEVVRPLLWYSALPYFMVYVLTRIGRLNYGTASAVS